MIIKDRNAAMMRIQRLFLFFLFLINIFSLHAMNIIRPYEVLLAPYHIPGKRFQLASWSEYGFATEVYPYGEYQANSLMLWNPTQDSLAMLKGFSPESNAGRLLTTLDAQDDGVRGHFIPHGNLKVIYSGAIGARLFFGEGWSISSYLPILSMRLSDVCYIDQTRNVTDDDVRVRELLTNNIAANIYELGGLDIGGWRRSGIGDLILLLGWARDFRQSKPFLKQVGVHWHIGVWFPTGKVRDEDKLLALPFGFDGAFSVPYCLGLDLTFAACIRAGIEVELIQTFGNVRCRRIKTDESQTDLFLLQKAPAYKDFGMTQRFDLYAETFDIVPGWNFKVGYQYIKHGEDVLSLETNAFSPLIANSAEYLQECTIHSIFLNTSYNFGVLTCYDAPVVPQLSLFMRLPFNGKRSIAYRTIGGCLSIDF